MKKFLSVLMALILLVQATPLSALAETSAMTENELVAACALAGYGDDAPGFREGMEVNGNLTAKQLIEYLDEVLDSEIHTLENYYEDLENTLYDLRQNNAAAYARMTSGENEGMEDKLHTLFRQTEGTRSQLEYWKTRLDYQSSAILNNVDRLSDGGLTDYETRLCVHRIRSAVEEIRAIRTEIVQEADGHMDSLTRQLNLFKGVPSNANGPDAIIGLWAEQVLDSNSAPVSETSVKAASLFPQRQTLLGRLSPIADAQADTEQEATVLVADEKHVYIKVVDAQGKDINGAQVTAKDQLAEKDPKTVTQKTENMGIASIPIEGFELEEDTMTVEITITADGYRKAILGKVDLKKGGTYKQYLAVDDGTPYIAECSFDGHECLFNEYMALYSNANHYEFPIRVTVVNPTSDHYQLHLIYEDVDTDKDKNPKQFYFSRNVEANKETEIEIEQEWRRRVKPGGAQYTLNIDGKDSKSGTDDKRVVLLALQKTSANASDDGKAVEGAPKLTNGNYILFKSNLKVEAAKLSQPFTGVPGNPSFLSGMTGFADISFPMNIGGEVFPTGSAGIDLPFADFTPRLNVAIDGSFSLVVGKDAGTFGKEKGPIKSWQSGDAAFVSKYVKAQEYQYAWMNKVEKGCTEATLMQGKGGLKTGNVQGSFGVFVGLIFGIEYSEAEGKWSSTNLQGIIGGAFTLGVTFSFQFMAGVFPITVGFNISASLGISFQLGGTCSINSDLKLTDEAVKSVGFDPKLGGFTIFFKFMITGFIGLGVKGFASATVNAYAFFNIVFQVHWDGSRYLKVSGGGGFYILLEVIFVHARFDIWGSGEKPIYEGEWPKPSAKAPEYSDLFLTRAQADEEEPEETPPYVAADYPELAPEVTLEYGPVTQISSNMQVAEIGGAVYAFYIVPEAGANGRDRVTWRNIATGQTGTFEQALKDAADRKYRFTRNSDDSNILDLSQIDEVHNWENLVDYQEYLYDRDDVFFSLARIDANDSRALEPVFQDLWAISVLNGIVEQTGENEASLTGKTEVYVLGFMPDGSGGLTCDLPSIHDMDLLNGSSGSRLEPAVQPSRDITWRMLWSERITDTEDLLSSSLSSSGVFQDRHMSLANQAANASSTWDLYEYDAQVTLAIGKTVKTFTFEAPNIHRTFESSMVKSGDYLDKYIMIPGMHGGVITATPEVTGARVQTSSTRKVLKPNYYAIETAENGNEQLWFKAEEYGCMIAEEKTIPYYNVLQGDDYDQVFYLVEEESPDGQALHHMKAARIKHFRNNPDDMVYTFVDLDITIPGAQFQVQEVAGTVYAYWLETQRDAKNDTMCVYRLRAVAYDPTSGISSDDFVLAQFKAPTTQTIHNVLLTKEGKGYYAISNSKTDGKEASVYSFTFRLTAALDLDCVVLDNDVVHRGENDTIAFRVTNSGSLAIRSFSLTESVVSGSNAKLVLTGHCDMVNPDNNYLHLDGDKPENDITGKEALWHGEPPMDNLTQNYWEVKKTTRTFTSPTSYTDKEETVTLDAAELLPGQVGYFYMIIKTPESWKEQEYKDLRFELEDFTANRNQLKAMAVQNGLIPPSNDPGANEITWSRSGGLRANNAADNGGLYAVMSNAPKSALLDHEIENLVVMHRVYVTPDGERRVSFTLSNDAAHYRTTRLYCEVYLDGSEKPIYMDLPYDPDSTSHERTHTFDMPVSALANGTNAKKAKVTIRGISGKETGVLDNSFEVELDGKKALSIIVQPQSRTVLVGETVRLTVKAGGGTPPYSYQWQQYKGRDLGWQNLMNETTDTLTLEDVALSMNGQRFRCVVRDMNQDEAVSDEAILTVLEQLPATGDTTHPLLYLGLGAALMLVCIVYALRRRKESEQAS